MQKTIGLTVTEHIAAGLVENGRLVSALQVFPGGNEPSTYLLEFPAEEILRRMHELIELARAGHEIAAIGVGLPGIIRNGVVEESPHLPQLKGQMIEAALEFLLSETGSRLPVHVINDADAIAAGLAITRGKLDQVIRVWVLGKTIGYGCYPQDKSAGAGGHLVVTLDTKENYCSCGGRGHLEGIMGHRAMRLRFLDLEPEEVFAEASAGDARCLAFVDLWHRGLAAATANSIHLDGPGTFFLSGPNARFVQLGLLHRCLHEMVKLSPLQGSPLEIVPASDELAIIGAAMSAARTTST
jgi:predicted NBD/HSP70 family sugar kinase